MAMIVQSNTIDVEDKVARAIQEIGSNTFILAAPFAIEPSLAERLAKEGRIGGYVADEPSDGLAVAGNWLDATRSCWRLKPGGSATVLFLGAETSVGGRMLLEAFRAGVREIVLVSASNAAIRIPVIASLARRAAVMLMARVRKRVMPGWGSYENAFAELYSQVGTAFRIPPGQVVADRALLVIGSLGPGGAERQVTTTAIGLVERSDWRPIVAVSGLANGGDFHLGALSAARIPVETVDNNPMCLHGDFCRGILAASCRRAPDGFDQIAHIILCYASFIAEMRPALVHCWMDYCNVLAGIAADMAGEPALVLSGRSVAPDNFDLHQPYMLPGYRALLARRPNDPFTNNSQAGAVDYARWLGVEKDRFVVIHNGFDFPQLPPTHAVQDLLMTLGIPKGAPVIGTIIRFSEEKRPFLWLDVAAATLKHIPECYCVAFGEGPLLEEARRKVGKRGLAHRIKLPGLTRNPWIALAAMDVFVLTSRVEGLPNVLVEAQAMGVPVVTTGNGGMVETYIDGETGLTERTQRAGPLAEAIVSILKDPTRLHHMSQRARAFALDHFHREAMVQATLSAYVKAGNVRSPVPRGAFDWSPAHE